MLKTTALIGAAVISAASVAGASAYVASNKDTDLPTVPVPQRTATAPKTVSPNIQQHFAAFRRERRGDDAPPRAAVAGVAAGEARRLSPGSEVSVWLAPGPDDSSCKLVVFASGDGAQSCTPNDAIVEGKDVSAVTQIDGSVDIVGLVPDGIATVNLKFADGSVRELPVRNNVYADHGDQPTVSVTFADGGKMKTIPAQSLRG